MDIVRVRYFLAVCEHGSFTAAANVCGVSQPSVTTGVRRLERAVGGQLFERRHPVRLTALGAELRPLIEALQLAADGIAAAVERTNGSPAMALLGRGARGRKAIVAAPPSNARDGPGRPAGQARDHQGQC